MGKYFGTDGVRGIAGADLTCELAMKLGRGVAAVLTDGSGRKPRILIGKDTRQSGDMLEPPSPPPVQRGRRRGGPGRSAHPPAVAYLVTKYKADAGVVISASHNPMEFNASRCSPPPATSCPTRWRPASRPTSTTTAGTSRWPPRRGGAGVLRADGLRDYVDHLYEASAGT